MYTKIYVYQNVTLSWNLPICLVLQARSLETLKQDNCLRKFFARDPISGGCVPKSLPREDNTITRVIQVAGRI